MINFISFLLLTYIKRYHSLSSYEVESELSRWQNMFLYLGPDGAVKVYSLLNKKKSFFISIIQFLIYHLIYRRKTEFYDIQLFY